MNPTPQEAAPVVARVTPDEMRQRIKARFDHEGIVIPLPQRVVWHHDAPRPPAAPADAPAPATSE